MKKIICYVIALVFSNASHAVQINDPLPSWNNGSIKNNIIEFVQTVTDPSNPNFVPPEDRIATIDNDGTLWVEHPIYTQVIFGFDRIKATAPQHPEWKTNEPFASLLKGQFNKLTTKDIMLIMAMTQTGMTDEKYQVIAKQWLQTAINPRFHRHYTELVYQPMLEVMDYLRQNNFKVYIVSGGGQDFIRAFAQQTYKVPPENVIGSAVKTKYTYQNNKPVLIKLPQLLIENNYAGKAEDINLFIGKKPIIAFGNSTGDQQMLEWTQSNPKKHLMLLVHHDDAKREFAYGPDTKIGTFSNALMQEAKKNNWQVISMKNDWKVIFPGS